MGNSTHARTTHQNCLQGHPSQVRGNYGEGFQEKNSIAVEFKKDIKFIDSLIALTVQMVQGSTSGQFPLPMWALPSLRLKSREGGHDKNALLKFFFVFHLCKILTTHFQVPIAY